ncbi:MAG: hypothetical protein ACI9UK_001524 [Candidatus Krumholzibacteriia bacterium]|jgi:hypothetical protein
MNARLKLQLMMLIVIAGAYGAPSHAGPSRLNHIEADGYLQWMHSLETASVARIASGLPEASVLFPFEVTAWDLDDPRPYRHLSISKAVTQLEAIHSSRSEGNLSSTLMALANARNYTNLSEYDSALVWYKVAASLDSTGSFKHEIAHEGFACAVSARDSLAIAQMLTNTLGANDLVGRQKEIVLAYRWLLINRDSDALNHLTQKVAAHDEALSPRLLFWQSYSLSWLGERERTLENLRVLVQNGGLSHGLTEGQRTWVLIGIADTYFMLGAKDIAYDLYKILSNSRVMAIKMWGKFQVAGLDFIAGKYTSASYGYEEVCASERLGSWQDHACEMEKIVSELERIKAEGEPYGVANHYER